MAGQEEHNLIDGSANRVNLNPTGLQVKAGPNKSIQITDDRGNGLQIAPGGAITLLGSGTLPAAGVTSFDGRTGAVTPQSGDYVAAQVTGAEATANKNQPNGYLGLNANGEVMSYGLNLPNAKFISVMQNFNAGAGANNVVYTAPAGRRAVLNFITLLNNAGGTTTTFLQQWEDASSVLHAMAASGTSVTAGAAEQAFNQNQFILESGESLVFTNTLATQFTVFGVIIEFDNSSGLHSVKVTSGLAAGDNVLYTVPLGKTAMLIGSSLSPGPWPANSGSDVAFLYFNGTGAGRTLKWAVQPAGSGASSSKYNLPTLSPANNTLANQGKAKGMGPGDFVNLNLDSGAAGGYLWFNVLEF